jgi:hypothetical protein
MRDRCNLRHGGSANTGLRPGGLSEDCRERTLSVQRDVRRLWAQRGEGKEPDYYSCCGALQAEGFRGQ